MRKVEFLTDYAGFKAGDQFHFESMHASELVRTEKVAKFIDVEEEKPKKKGKTDKTEQ